MPTSLRQTAATSGRFEPVRQVDQGRGGAGDHPGYGNDGSSADEENRDAVANERREHQIDDFSDTERRGMRLALGTDEVRFQKARRGRDGQREYQ